MQQGRRTSVWRRGVLSPGKSNIDPEDLDSALHHADGFAMEDVRNRSKMVPPPGWTERFSSGPVLRSQLLPVHEWPGERAVRELGESWIPAEVPPHSRRLRLPLRPPRVARPLGRRVQLVGGGDTADSP